MINFAEHFWNIVDLSGIRYEEWTPYLELGFVSKEFKELIKENIDDEEERQRQIERIDEIVKGAYR